MIPRDHHRSDQADGIPDPYKIRLDRIDEHLLRVWLRCALGRDSCIGENDVGDTETCNPLSECSFQAYTITDVCDSCEDLAAGFLNLGYGLVEVVGIRHCVGHAVDLIANVDGNDGRALGGESYGVT